MSPIIYYSFKQQPPFPLGSVYDGWGASHYAELWYVFDHLDQMSWDWTAGDRRLAEEISSYWVNFAKHGNPNGKGVPNWPAFSDKNPVVMYFNRTPHSGPVPSTNGLEVLDGYFAWRRTPEGGAPAK